MSASQSLVCALNLAKETISFIINASGEEESIGWPRGLSITKGQSPKAIYRNDQAFLVLELTKQSTSVWIKRVDTPIAKVTYQQVIAELAKIGGSESQTRRRIHCATGNEAFD